MEEVKGMDTLVNNEIAWNDQVQLIFSDVDETIAAEYESVTPELATELNLLFEEGKSIIFITGAGIKRVQSRVTDHIKPEYRKQVLVGSCSGAEIHGFDEKGEILPPFYSVLDQMMNDEQKREWREVIDQIVDEFKLEKHEVMPTPDFKREAGDNPLAVMYEDRGPQITFEVLNAHELTKEQADKMPHPIEVNADGKYDYRDPMMKRATELLQERNIPITPRKAGEYAIDFALAGVNKTTCVKEILGREDILTHIGVTKDIINQSQKMEIWGDKFSTVRGGTDRHIAEGLPKEVRAIDFRREDPKEFQDGYNVVVWRGKNEKQAGTEEFLKQRHLKIAA